MVWFDDRFLPLCLRFCSCVEAIPQPVNCMRPVIEYAQLFENSFRLVDVKWCRHLSWIRAIAYKKPRHDLWIRADRKLSPRPIETELGSIGVTSVGTPFLVTSLRKINPPRGWLLCTWPRCVQKIRTENTLRPVVGVSLISRHRRQKTVAISRYQSVKRSSRDNKARWTQETSGTVSGEERGPPPKSRWSVPPRPRSSDRKSHRQPSIRRRHHISWLPASHGARPGSQLYGDGALDDRRALLPSASGRAYLRAAKHLASR